VVLTLAAACTVVGLSQFGNTSLEAYKKGTTLFLVIFVHLILGHTALV
jgi:hypothetical protein